MTLLKTKQRLFCMSHLLLATSWISTGPRYTLKKTFVVSLILIVQYPAMNDQDPLQWARYFFRVLMYDKGVHRFESKVELSRMYSQPVISVHKCQVILFRDALSAGKAEFAFPMLIVGGQKSRVLDDRIVRSPRNGGEVHIRSKHFDIFTILVANGGRQHGGNVPGGRSHIRSTACS